MLDGCGIETIDDKLSTYGEQVVAIDARWLWDRDDRAIRRRGRRCESSRSMLDGCGIETPRPGASISSASQSRSMLDGCGIET